MLMERIIGESGQLSLERSKTFATEDSSESTLGTRLRNRMSPPSSLESEEWHSFTLSDDPDDSDEGDMEPLNPKGAQPKATPVPPGFPRYSPAGEGQRINVRSSAVGFVDMSLLWHAVTVGFRNMVCFVVVAELYMVFLATALSTTELTSSWRPWYDRDGGVSPRILIWTGPPSEISDEASGLAAAHDSSARHGNWTACNFTAHGNVNAYDVPKPCEVTYDRRLLMESDAIVFHADRVNVSDLPRERAAGQLWVFWARTHPVMPPFVREVGLLGAVSRYLRGKTLPSSLPIQLARVFNWTMSHRKDSVVHVAHKTFGPRFLSTGDSPTSSISSSDRSTMASRRDAAWIASDCELERFKEEHERLRSSHNDRHYRNTPTRPIYLHVMPNCGAGQCESPAECVAQVAKKFKFIVVSQSPACFQSVSDLVYEAFKHDLVPIVLAAPYTTFNFPPKSVLNAAALRAHGRLYSHLTDLLDHPAEYEGYFAWKRNFTVSALEDELCPLCAALQEKTLRATPTWLDIRKWWERHVTCSGAHSIGTSFYKFTIA